jgi:uracil-DNA glycosylase
MRETNNFKEIVRNAEDWRKKICKCDQCYSCKTALIFPPFQQKIVFISESPYNFPSEECKTIGDFLEKDFLEGIKEKTEGIIPANIFDFLYKTFRPIFSNSITKGDVEKFLRCVYWTHAAKKSLKCLNGSRKGYAEKCCEATIKELKEIRPQLLVVASSIALQILFNRRYRESLEKQVEKVRKHEKLLTVEELSCKEGALLLKIYTLKDCEVAVFPNPSPTAAKWKKQFYEKDENKKVLSYIIEHCKPYVYDVTQPV